MKNYEDEDIEETESRNLKRFWILVLVINLVVLFIILKLVDLQIINAKFYQEKAKIQHESMVELLPERGKIYDRNNKLIASTIKSISIAVDPKVIKGKYTICKMLERATGISYLKFLKKINSSKRAFEWLYRGLEPIKAKELQNYKVSGLLKFIEPKRIYIYGDVASQVIGNTNIDNIGMSGIEKSYDSILRGRKGFMIFQRDAKGWLHASANMPYLAPKNGRSLKLTLDIELQRIVDYELKKGIEEFKAKSGSVVAIEPGTGEILAMASYPNYDLNNIAQRKSGSMKNRVISDTYEPGSTFKIVTAATALEEGVVKPDMKFNAYGGLLDFGTYRIRDDHPMNEITFAEALIHSSNIVFAQVGDLLSVYKFYKYIRDFGFGNTLGIDIKGEVSGKMPPLKKIYPATKQFISHGYGISVTSLQLVSAYSVIANDGNLMRPYVVKEIYNNDGSVYSEQTSQKIRRVVSHKTCETLKELMVKVVEEGTGKKAQIYGVKIAGKTGTAQQLVKGEWTKQYYSSFAGFFPAENPKIVLLVVIDNPEIGYYGGAVAAPIFKRIVQKWLLINNDILNASKESESETVVLPSFNGFFSDDALKMIRNYGLEAKLYNLNDGIVINQEPKAGTILKKGDIVIIYAKKYKDLIQDTLDIKSNDNHYKPEVVGMPLKKALNILHSAGYRVKVIGSGFVKSQIWKADSKKGIYCLLKCDYD